MRAHKALFLVRFDLFFQLTGIRVNRQALVRIDDDAKEARIGLKADGRLPFAHTHKNALTYVNEHCAIASAKIVKNARVVEERQV